jgi:N-acetylneuraminic acid mutarotase
VRNRGSAGTPIPGRGVFGHAGAIAGNSIVYIDGVTRNDQAPKYRLVHQSWLGTIDTTAPQRITWRVATPHPEPRRYRAAAAGCGPLVVFAGGTDNPYNYTGIGYDQNPSSPIASAMAYDPRTDRWRALPSAPTATMDHRALVIRDRLAVIVGGMQQDQQVARDVIQWSFGSCND